MIRYKYIGKHTKLNGKIDVKVGQYSFLDIEPNAFNIIIPEGSQEEKYLSSAKDPFDGTPLYTKQN